MRFLVTALLWLVVVACQPGSGLLAEARAAGVDAVVVRMRGAADLGALWALRRLMRTHAVSLVHTHSSTDSWLGALAARSLRLPVVRSRHVSIANGGNAEVNSVTCGNAGYGVGDTSQEQ